MTAVQNYIEFFERQNTAAKQGFSPGAFCLRIVDTLSFTYHHRQRNPRGWYKCRSSCLSHIFFCFARISIIISAERETDRHAMCVPVRNDRLVNSCPCLNLHSGTGKFLKSLRTAQPQTRRTCYTKVIPETNPETS